jgi:hypothetical protein
MKSEERPPDDQPPPILGTWPRVYRGVLLYLACLIAALYAFMKAFSGTS